MVAKQGDENFQFQNGDHGGEKVEMQFSWSDFDAERISGRILRTVVRGFGVFPNASTMNLESLTKSAMQGHCLSANCGFDTVQFRYEIVNSVKVFVPDDVGRVTGLFVFFLLQVTVHPRGFRESRSDPGPLDGPILLFANFLTP